MEDKDSKLLGEILIKTGVTLAVYGIDVEQLAKGEVEVTYEEMEYLLKDNPITHVIAMNLKEELTASEYYYNHKNGNLFACSCNMIHDNHSDICRTGGRTALQNSNGE